MASELLAPNHRILLRRPCFTVHKIAMNTEKYPREPLAALGISLLALLIVTGSVGVAQREWLPSLIGLGAPVLTYLLFPSNRRMPTLRLYAAALVGAMIVLVGTLAWFV